jgi:hypothetical protein
VVGEALMEAVVAFVSFLLGAALVSVGAYLIYPPAGLIVWGGTLIVISLQYVRGVRRRG